MSSAASPPPGEASIAIVGAGPGGLTAARILQQHDIQVTVYERDPGRTTRDQGGSLDLRSDDGQLALAEAGLIDRFHELARPEGQELRQVDPVTGDTFFHHIPDADELEKPEIDRTELRTLLLDSVSSGTVHWGARVVAVEDVSNAAPGALIRFADGSSTRHDLVVGADGAFSPVRKTLSDVVPGYTGVTFIEAWFNDVAARHPWLDQFCGGGAAVGADGMRGMFAQRNAGNHIRVYIMLKVPLNWLESLGLAPDNANGIRHALLDEFSSWNPELRRLITDNDGPFIPRPIWTLPVGHRWERSPSLTLIGDAAHLMPPVGVGVNLAMLDAYELAIALTRQPTINDAVHVYEDIMWDRSADYANQAHAMFTMLLDGAPPPTDG